MKKILIVLLLLSDSIISLAQRKEPDTERQALKEFMTRNDSFTKPRYTSKEDIIRNILMQYNSAVQKLNVAGTENLFTSDSKIYESGSSEGNYAHYMENHLVPELKEFKSFTYSDYMVEVKVDGNYAFTTESYNYTIVIAKDNSVVKRKGLATSVLKKIKGEWKIIVSHNSSGKQL